MAVMMQRLISSLMIRKAIAGKGYKNVQGS